MPSPERTCFCMSTQTVATPTWSSSRARSSARVAGPSPPANPQARFGSGAGQAFGASPRPPERSKSTLVDTPRAASSLAKATPALLAFADLNNVLASRRQTSGDSVGVVHLVHHLTDVQLHPLEKRAVRDLREPRFLADVDGPGAADMCRAAYTRLSVSGDPLLDGHQPDGTREPGPWTRSSGHEKTPLRERELG
jgi:hypothetical protein